jgi:sugar/nucleoside kinase (ribokinase family)
VSELSMRPHRLVLVGSILVDILMYMDRLPERGGDRIATSTLFASGGGFNVLSGAARLGLAVCHAGRVGDGPMGTQVMRDLLAAGITCALPQVRGEDTGFDIGMVEADAERTFVTAPGTEARLSLEDLRAIPLQQGDAIYVSGYDLGYPISGSALEAWLPTLSSDYLLVVDPGPLVAEIPAARLSGALARTNILSLNTRELNVLMGDREPPVAAQQLAKRLAPDGFVVARAGEMGCWLASASQAALHIPGRSARVVDTTGAGDAHTAALLARLAAGDDFSTAVHIANVAASLSIEHPGPATGPTAQELQKALLRPAQ